MEKPITVACIIPAGRPFDVYAAPLMRQVLACPSFNVRFYVGLKHSNYDSAKSVNEFPATYLFEPEDVKSIVPAVNACYQHVTEEYVILLPDDFSIRGKLLEVIEFVKAQPIPIACLGVNTPTYHQTTPNEVMYLGQTTGHGGGNGSHPTYTGIPTFCAETYWLRQTFPHELYPVADGLTRYYTDDLCAFRLQYKYRFPIPVWINDIVWFDNQTINPWQGHEWEPAIARYRAIVRRIEETGDLF